METKNGFFTKLSNLTRRVPQPLTALSDLYGQVAKDSIYYLKLEEKHYYTHALNGWKSLTTHVMFQLNAIERQYPDMAVYTEDENSLHEGILHLYNKSLIHMERVRKLRIQHSEDDISNPSSSTTKNNSNLTNNHIITHPSPNTKNLQGRKLYTTLRPSNINTKNYISLDDISHQPNYSKFDEPPLLESNKVNFVPSKPLDTRKLLSGSKKLSTKDDKSTITFFDGPNLIDLSDNESLGHEHRSLEPSKKTGSENEYSQSVDLIDDFRITEKFSEMNLQNKRETFVIEDYYDSYFDDFESDDGDIQKDTIEDEKSVRMKTLQVLDGNALHSMSDENYSSRSVFSGDTSHSDTGVEKMDASGDALERTPPPLPPLPAPNIDAFRLLNKSGLFTTRSEPLLNDSPKSNRKDEAFELSSKSSGTYLMTAKTNGTSSATRSATLKNTSIEPESSGFTRQKSLTKRLAKNNASVPISISSYLPETSERDFLDSKTAALAAQRLATHEKNLETKSPNLTQINAVAKKAPSSTKLPAALKNVSKETTKTNTNKTKTNMPSKLNSNKSTINSKTVLKSKMASVKITDSNSNIKIGTRKVAGQPSKPIPKKIIPKVGTKSKVAPKVINRKSPRTLNSGDKLTTKGSLNTNSGLSKASSTPKPTNTEPLPKLKNKYSAEVENSVEPLKETNEDLEERLINSIPGIDKNAAKQIFSEIVVHGDEVHWSDIAGLEAAKSSLKEAVVYPFLRPDLFRGLREPVRGMLLFGPPGTGKTMLARAVATESHSTFFSISASSLTSKYLGESEKLVRALFSIAKKLSPSIIFVDEIDSIMGSRDGDSESESSRRIKNEFLIQWSSLSSAAAGNSEGEDDERVLVLAATNLPWSIDEAARRRFVRRQYIPLPEDSTRAAQIKNLLSRQKHSLNDDDLESLINSTQGYSGSDITSLAKDAAMGPLRELGDKLLETERESIRPINLSDFQNSLLYIRPSVSTEGLGKYEEWAAKFGSSGV